MRHLLYAEISGARDEKELALVDIGSGLDDPHPAGLVCRLHIHIDPGGPQGFETGVIGSGHPRDHEKFFTEGRGCHCSEERRAPVYIFRLSLEGFNFPCCHMADEYNVISVHLFLFHSS
jgi:hypothetical protein